MGNKSKKIWALRSNQSLRNRLVGDINLLDQDEPARAGSDQEIKVLKEMSELQDFENENWNRGSV